MSPATAIERAYELVLHGSSVVDILAALRSDGAKRPREALGKALQRVADAPPEEHLGWCIEQARTLVRLHLDADTPDLAGALKSLQELARLTNSYETARRERETAPSGEPKGSSGEPDDARHLLDLVRGSG